MYKKFVIQEHHATHLHYDFRLEMDGVLKSWAVPKGVPTDVNQKRLAIQVEDHSLDYIDFEGIIPEGNYGAGTVRIWDKGDYELINRNESEIEFVLNGKKVKGRYVLVKPKNFKKNEWLLIKIKE